MTANSLQQHHMYAQPQSPCTTTPTMTSIPQPPNSTRRLRKREARSAPLLVGSETKATDTMLHRLFFPLEIDPRGVSSRPSMQGKTQTWPSSRPQLALGRGAAREILDPESTFLYRVAFPAIMELKPPAQLVNRVEKGEDVSSGFCHQIVTGSRTPLDDAYTVAVCDATIDEFTGLDVLRDNRHVRVSTYKPAMVGTLSWYVLPKLAAFQRIPHGHSGGASGLEIRVSVGGGFRRGR